MAIDSDINSLKEILSKLDELSSEIRSIKETLFATHSLIAESLNKISKQNIVIKLDDYNLLLDYISKYTLLYTALKQIDDSESWQKVVKRELMDNWGLIRELIFLSIRREISNKLSEIFQPFYDIKSELYEVLGDISSTISKFRRKTNFYLQLLNKLNNLEEISLYDNKLNYEDELLPYVIDLLLKIHNIPKSSIKSIDLHRKIDGIEFDVVITFNKNGIKTIAIELKESDLDKLIEQLSIREKYVNYIYGVISLEPEYVINRIIALDKMQMFQDRVGLICVSNKTPILLFKSKYKKTPSMYAFINQ